MGHTLIDNWCLLETNKKQIRVYLNFQSTVSFQVMVLVDFYISNGDYTKGLLKKPNLNIMISASFSFSEIQAAAVCT